MRFYPQYDVHFIDMIMAKLYNFVVLNHYYKKIYIYRFIHIFTYTYFKGGFIMFCKNCGFQLPENAAFCGNCGTKQDVPAAPAAPVAPVVPETQAAPVAPVAQPAFEQPVQPVMEQPAFNQPVQPMAQPVQEEIKKPAPQSGPILASQYPGPKDPVNVQPGTQEPKKKGKTGLIIAIISIVVVLLAAAAVLYFVVFKNSKKDYEKVVDTFYDSMNEMNINKLYSTLSPAGYAYAKGEIDDYYGSPEEYFLSGPADEYSIKHKITLATVYTDDVTLNGLENTYLWNGYVYDITKAVELDVELTFTSKTDKTDVKTENVTLSLIKVNGKWYIHNYSDYF